MQTRPVQQTRLKQGASLALTVAFFDDYGNPLDLTGATVACQVRDPTNLLVATPTLAVTPTAGTVALSVPDTSAWPIGLLRCDVRLSIAGTTNFSDTFGILIEPAVTVTT
jgi:hypothetical protein